MKNLFTTLALIFFISFTALAQANKTAVQTKETVKETGVQDLRVDGAEGHYCDYCKGNYPQSHFPCLMKVIKGKMNARTGAIEFAPGDPIPGVDVKLGKNPGGNLSMANNNNGVIEINNITAGNYKLVVTVPNSTPAAMIAGQPIGGIIVKGGKNPGGSSIILITNKDGEVTLNNLPAGNYRFTLSGPTASEKNNPLYQSTYTEKSNPLYKENR